MAEMKPSEVNDLLGTARRIASSINATMDDVFGVGTADSADFNIDPGWFWNINSDRGYEEIQDFEQGLERARAVAKDAIKRLNEKAQDAEEETESKTLKAYEGLDLHPEIARAANDLYRDGHYANAIEDAVKALNAFVRLRSGVEDRDGNGLMEFVFNPKNPIMAFNELKDDSDRDDRKAS